MSVKECEVTSEIHQQMKIDKNEKPLVSPQNVVSKFTFLYPDDCGDLEVQINGVAETDEDGDFVVKRMSNNHRKYGVITIEHSYSTSLQLVGRQIWRGALLLGDFVLHNGSSLLKGRTVLELGSGVGLTSIVAAMYAAEVICTDIDTGGILDLIRANASRNCKLMKANFSVFGLDFFAKQWSANLEAKLTNVTVILVADVIYDNDVTEAFVNTLKKLLASFPPKTVYIALEKRYVFTVADLDSVAPCYEVFLECLQEAQAKPPGSSWKVQQMAVDFPQYFNYERVKELVLWRISTE